MLLARQEGSHENWTPPKKLEKSIAFYFNESILITWSRYSNHPTPPVAGRGNKMRNSKNTISMFATQNPTDKYVVAIDDFFCYADSKAEAESIYNMAMTGSDGHIDNSCFGSIEIIPPRHYPRYINDYQPEGGIVDVTTRHPIDLIGYIQSNQKRYYSERKDVLATSTAKQRLAEAKEDFMAALGMSATTDWRKNRVSIV